MAQDIKRTHDNALERARRTDWRRTQRWRRQPDSEPLEGRGRIGILSSELARRKSVAAAATNVSPGPVHPHSAADRRTSALYN